MNALITAERLRELLHYDPDTGIFTWRVYRGRKAYPGDVAGGLSSNGYRQVAVDGRVYQASRLAFFYMLGEWPADEVDHRDMDKTNYRWANLRLATRSQNNANRKARADSRFGFKGVQWHKRQRRWTAKITFNWTQHYLGTFDTAEAAHAAYVAAACEFFGEFARAG